MVDVRDDAEVPDVGNGDLLEAVLAGVGGGGGGGGGEAEDAGAGGGGESARAGSGRKGCGRAAAP